MVAPEKEKPPEGILYVVATPLGNLADISHRAIDTLRSVDVIAAEDTRHTRRLLSHYGISGHLISCHEHNETEKTDFLVAKLRRGQSVALVSDAGTPSVSDPGYRTVAAAIAAGVRVVPIPGASAAVTALSASGLPSDRFCFIGFLPKKKGRQKEVLQRLADNEETLIFYESPRRIAATLKLLLEIFGERDAVIAREMTKLHEEFIRGRLSALIVELERRASVKGEMTLLVSGKVSRSGPSGALPETVISEIAAALAQNAVPPSELAAQLARRHDLPKNKIYKYILKVKAEMEG